MTSHDDPFPVPVHRARPRRRRRPRALVALLAVAALAGGGATVAGVLPVPFGDDVALAASATANGVTTSATTNRAQVAAGTAVTVTARVSSRAARSGSVVDVEVYDPAGVRVAQKFWSGQAFTAGRARSFSTTVTAPVSARTGTWTVKVGVFGAGWSPLVVWNDAAARFSVTAAATSAPTQAPTSGPATTAPTSTPTTTAPTSTTTAPTATTTRTTTAPPTSTATSGTAAPARFGLVPPGGTLPSGAQCAAWVRATPAPAEVKGANATANRTVGAPVAGATGLQARVDGSFTGTTEQILRWAACKWGVDEDHVKAQAAVESWWRMDTQGDWGADAARCAPGHGLGADGRAGQCPESFGLLQIRYPYNQPAFPYAATSSAFNADWAYAQWRACYTGQLTWLDTVERGKDYAAGDSWGCMGVWFSGRWYTDAANGYVTKVKGYLDGRIWETADFRQP